MPPRQCTPPYRPDWPAFQMLLIGLGAATAGFVVGRVFGVSS
jgi:hypothetical protein